MVLIQSGIYLLLFLFLLLPTSATTMVCYQWTYTFLIVLSSNIQILNTPCLWLHSSQHWQRTWRQNTDQTDCANVSGPMLQCLHCHKFLCISPLWWGHTGWCACQLRCKSWHSVQFSFWWYSPCELRRACHARLSHCLLCPSAQLGWIALPNIEAHFSWQQEICHHHHCSPHSNLSCCHSYTKHLGRFPIYWCHSRCSYRFHLSCHGHTQVNKCLFWCILPPRQCNLYNTQ